MKPSPTGWLVLFLLGAAHDVDARTGSEHRAELRGHVAACSPGLDLLLSLDELRGQVDAILSAMRSHIHEGQPGRRA